jgi:hypothetical protein
MADLQEVLGNIDTLDTMGYAPMDEQNRLMGQIENLNPADKQKARAKLLAPRFGSNDLNSRDLVMQRLGALPKEIREALAAKRLQIVDAEYYTTKLLTGQQNVRFFEDADTMLPGVRNISNGKMIKDVFFLCTAIQFTVGSGVSDVDPSDVVFDTPLAISQVANGEFELLANGNKYMLPKDSPLSMFADVQYGGIKTQARYTRTIDSPKWIEPQVPIAFNIRAAAAVTALHTWGRVKLIGAAVINY